MKIKSLLVQIRPRCFARWRCLPIFGALLDDFLQWMHDQNYTRGTISHYMETLPKVVNWLKRHRITSLVELTQRDLQVAKDHFPARQDAADGSSGH
jgi:site-specific recombinase XerD